LFGHDAPSFLSDLPPVQWPAGTPREHEQAAARECSCARRLVRKFEDGGRVTRGS
jgi:hypothetical protein